MSMSKQDFIALADAIREHNRYVDARSATSTPTAHSPFNAGHLEVLASFCKRQNSAFMPDRWTGYIAGENGPSGGTIKAKR